MGRIGRTIKLQLGKPGGKERHKGNGGRGEEVTV